MPSRRVMSWTVIFLPRSSMFISLWPGRSGHHGGAVGFELQASGEDLLGEHLGGAGTGRGHDVEVAGVLGQVVAQAFNLEVHRAAVAVEHRAIDQAVAGHVLPP